MYEKETWIIVDESFMHKFNTFNEYFQYVILIIKIQVRLFVCKDRKEWSIILTIITMTCRKASAARFTIYKVNKASKKKREKSSARRERKTTITLAVVLGKRSKDDYTDTIFGYTTVFVLKIENSFKTL